jgi:ABC-type nitrate/sulfonate/bicarbonate transport system permease component
MNAQMDTAGTFSVFIILAIVGVVMYQAMRVIERRFLFWSGDHMRAIGS